MDTILQATDEEMSRSVGAVASQLAKIHSGRANPALIEDLMVDYYGNKSPLKQLANISVPESRQLLVQPWDQNALAPIEKAITTSSLGFTPKNEGRSLRINIPQMTEERRKDLKKVIDDYAEKGRIAIRNHRQETIKSIKDSQTAGDIPEDESRRLQEDVQKIVDAKNKEIDALHEGKVKELMTV